MLTEKQQKIEELKEEFDLLKKNKESLLNLIQNIPRSLLRATAL